MPAVSIRPARQDLDMAVNLYESATLQCITGATIRPGEFILTQKAVSICRLKKGTKVLDAGCGNGATVRFLKNRHCLNAFGLDLSPSLLNRGRQGDPELALILGNAADLPMPDSTFRAVFCECVLSLIPDPAAVLEEFYRVLMPGGFLILADMYRNAPVIEQENHGRSVNCCFSGAMEKNNIQSMAARTGFNIFLWEDHTALLKSLAAKIVFACGSMEKFWSSFYRDSASTTVSGDNAGMEHGYYLLGAKKVYHPEIKE